MLQTTLKTMHHYPPSLKGRERALVLPCKPSELVIYFSSPRPKAEKESTAHSRAVCEKTLLLVCTQNSSWRCGPLLTAEGRSSGWKLWARGI